jgi:hypothetical protein
LGVWKYKDNNTVISDDEYWIPQKATRPPDSSIFHKPTDTCYRKGHKVWFESKYNRWVTLNPEYEYVEDAAFQSPYFISGGTEHLPENLRPVLAVSPLATPKPKSTAFSSTGTYRVTETSESESKPSDKEPDQQLADSSDQVSESVLSHLAELSLVAQGKLREELDPQEPPEQDKKTDSFDEEFEDALERSKEAPKESKESDPPTPPDSPIEVDPPTMATPASLLGTCPTFKGKRKSAREFISNIEIYFKMNPQRITTDKTKILLALQNISDDAQQWKENEKTDLDRIDSIKSYNDWAGFRTRFLKNWEEIDSSGNAYSELLKLNKWRYQHGKK